MGFLFLTASGCSGAKPAPVAPDAKHEGAVDSEVAAALRPELTVDEVRLKEALAARVQTLAGFGERHTGHPWELAEAADYLASEFESLGYAVERQGYEMDGAAAQNISVTIGGGQGGDQVIVVGAHYDSPRENAAGNRGTAGAAMLLELAQLLQGARLTRTIRLVAFALGEAPNDQGAGQGAHVFFKESERVRNDAEERLRQEREQKERGELPASLPELPVNRSRVVMMVGLDRVGSYPTIDAKSAELDSKTGDAGGRGKALGVSIWASESAQDVRMAAHEQINDAPFAVLNQKPGGDAGPRGDSEPFWSAGVPTLVVSGSGEGALDADALTRMTLRIRRTLSTLAGEELQTDDLLMR